MSDNDLSYCELRAKEVVNAADGKRMGRITDIMFSRDDGTVTGIVVPYCKRSFFGKSQDIFIPWKCVCKIGEDVILVNLSVDDTGRVSCISKELPPKKGHKNCDANCKKGHGLPPPEEPPHDFDCPPHPECDYRCEKCMLFDCAYRWSHMN